MKGVNPKSIRFWGEKMNADRIDLAILNALQKNAAQRLEDLARVVKLAASSVHDRLRRLERDKVIRRWTVEVDYGALGLGVLAYIGVRATRPCSELVEALRVIPEIEEAHSIAGQMSMLLKVRVATTQDLLSLVDRLREVPGVDSTETTIVLQTQFTRPLDFVQNPKATSAARIKQTQAHVSTSLKE